MADDLVVQLRKLQLKYEEAERQREHEKLQRQEAERQRQEAEQQRDEAEQQRDEAEVLAGKSIIMHGLPELRDHPETSCSSSKSKPSVPSNHGEAEVEIKSFRPCISMLAEAIKEGIDQGVRSKLCKQHGLIKPSIIWLHPVPLKYSTETDIAVLVSSTLIDIATAIARPLGDARRLNIGHGLELVGDRPDIWVMLRRGRPVGVVEVKKPDIGQKEPGGDALSHKKILGELYDYMMTLRCFEGLERVYGILTTYDEWRICWLEDTDDDARSTDMPAAPAATDEPRQAVPNLFDGLPLWPFTKEMVRADIPCEVMTQLQLSTSGNSAGGAAATEPKRRFFATEVIKRSDTNLVAVLASVLIKMASSPSKPVTEQLDDKRRYRTVDGGQWRWTKLAVERCTFQRWINPSVSKYSLLAPLGHGASARAYLALGGEAVCVLKFPLHATTTESRQQELTRWKKIWGADLVKEQTLADEHVLVLPYVKTCHGSVEEQTEVVREAARKAVIHMVNKGFWHKDCCWRHVGLCYQAGVGTCAVLIDLENVDEITTEGQKAAARAAMLRDLGLSP
jgi:hypothetical protein